MYNAKAYSAASEKSPLASTTIARRDPTEKDVQIEILFCGICHSDLHQARNERSGVMPTVYPCVPGHEIVGRVTKVGPAMTKFKVGGPAPIRCRSTEQVSVPSAKQGFEQFCPTFILTYNFPDKHTGGVTYGGYSDSIIIHREVRCSRCPRSSTSPGPHRCYALASLPTHPCTTGESRRTRRSASSGWADSVVFMGVKFAHALGAQVVLFTTSPGKKDDALRLGADEVVISRNADEMAKLAQVASISSSTPSSADHDINAYLNLLRRDGNICLVGAPEKPLAVAAFNLPVWPSQSLAGSPIGSIPETQEMLDFCGKNNITADVEIIPIQKVNEACTRGS